MQYIQEAIHVQFYNRVLENCWNTASVPVTATDQPALKQIQHHGLLPVSH